MLMTLITCDDSVQQEKLKGVFSQELKVKYLSPMKYSQEWWLQEENKVLCCFRGNIFWIF